MSAAKTDLLSSDLDADLAPVALILIDARRRIEAVNAQAEALFGLSKRALRQRALSEVVFHDSPLFDLIDKAIDLNGDLSSPSVPLSGPSLEGGLVDVRISVREGGLALAIAPVMQRDVETAQNLAQFARILGHEVKNPLAGISGAAQLLMRNARDDQGELLDLIRSETGRIERLVNRLSVFELFSAPRRAAFNIHEVLDRVIQGERAASHGRIRIRRDYDPSLPEVFGDIDHLHEAFQNVVRNAVEASDDLLAGDGAVTVRTAYEPGLGLGIKKAGGRGRIRRAVRVTVEDYGPGIPPELQARMFEMFQTTKPRGSGMGLSVVSEVIAAHGGHVHVESRPGRTRFSLFLPLAKELI
ncbi:MAG: ATP-binding protein [Pseudomonadota bacterium]